jgi:hypothetical protein
MVYYVIIRLHTSISCDWADSVLVFKDSTKGHMESKMTRSVPVIRPLVRSIIRIGWPIIGGNMTVPTWNMTTTTAIVSAKSSSDAFSLASVLPAGAVSPRAKPSRAIITNNTGKIGRLNPSSKALPAIRGTRLRISWLLTYRLILAYKARDIVPKSSLSDKNKLANVALYPTSCTNKMKKAPRWK